MRHLTPFILLLAAALAGCAGKAPAPPQTPPPPLCKASEGSVVAFRDIKPGLAGTCIKTRGLAMRSLLYENGEAYAKRQDGSPFSGRPGSRRRSRPIRNSSK